MNRQHLAWGALMILLCLFVAGLAWLFQVRFERGDVYPEYSSLRADPLGTMALYESLAKLDALTVRRDFSPGNRLPSGEGSVYLHLGAPMQDWESVSLELFEEVESFLNHGGRLVITFFPESTNRFNWRAAMRGKGMGPGATNAPPGAREVTLEKHWGAGIAHLPLNEPGDRANLAQLSGKMSHALLPDYLEWHSSVVFTNLTGAWQTIYARGKHPVVIERNFGSGSVVMATDTYYLSNEALLREREPGFLVWLVGAARRVFFDESHFGLIEQGGVATLIRKYRLHGVAAGLLALVCLYAWKNAFSLVPPLPAGRRAQFVAGKDAAAGFVNLLRRNLAAKDILNVCFSEWTKSLSKANPHLIARVDQAQALIEREEQRPPHARNPARVYREICSILSVRRK